MKKSILPLIFLCATLTVFGYRDRFTKVTSAELEFEAGDKVILSMDRTALKSLTLVTTKGPSKVPEKEIDGIGFPKLDTIAVLFGTYQRGDLKGVEYKYVRLNYGSEKEKAFGEYPSVSFFFYDGKYHHREITRKVSDTSWQTDSPDGGGTTSILRDPK